MVITIDALSVNGKSTLARRISKELNFKNFNTGAIYRCIALEIINKNLDINLDINNILKEIENIDINFEDEKVFLYGKDVTKEIREEEVTLKANKWATNSNIKQFVTKIQKHFIENYDLVMEGRDIGTRIAPNADIKFYLYCDFETRVQRLWKLNKSISIDEVRENLKRLDYIDINEGNFMKPQNAIEIDTTSKSLDEVFCIMMDKINLVRKN